MSAHPHASPSLNGGSRANLFIDDDHEEQPVRADAVPARRRGRGLVVPLGEPAAAAGGAAQFTRPDTGLSGLAKRAGDNARRADRNARHLLARVVARPFGALIAVTVVAGLLLAISWLGLSLRSTADARDEARDQQRAISAALDRSRDRVRGLIGERNRALAAARIADRRRDAATSTASTARARGHDAQQLKRERQRRGGRGRR
jgi:hypothetical protein